MPIVEVTSVFCSWLFVQIGIKMILKKMKITHLQSQYVNKNNRLNVVEQEECRTSPDNKVKSENII